MGEFSTWYTDSIWNYFKAFCEKYVYLIPFLVFGGYWGVPLGYVALNGSSTLLSIYLSDTTHLYFAINISVGAAVMLFTIARVQKCMQQLQSEAVFNANALEVYNHYNAIRRSANGVAPKLVSLMLAIGTALVFVRIGRAEEYKYWWGSYSHGYFNVYMTFIFTLMIYYGSQSLILLGYFSFLLISLIKKGLTPKIFHHDGSNGLQPLGNAIMRNWFNSVFIVGAVFIVIFFGYLGIEKNAVINMLVLFASITVPVIAILPLLFALIQLAKVRTDKLKQFGPLLNQKLIAIESRLEKGDRDLSNESSEFVDLYDVYSTIIQMNIFPFNPKALLSVVLIYTLQVGLTIYQLFM